MKKTLIVLAACLAAVVSCNSNHFLKETDYRKLVESDFDKKMDDIGEQFCDLDVAANLEEKEALKFLYAYMPLADVTDYPTEYFLENIRCSFKAKEEMPWGKMVPDLLFRHFVLPVRVNNESLDSSRTVFYDVLKERIKDMSMSDAILEVNHWCHEHVVYQPSDGRTSSPLATMKSAIGRCGEESTFTVAALRAVGIPARQVYTPRWAHTDDNHAWVEAWADGKWHFFGACEPEAVLDLGWFNEPASRAMLTHTKVFGDYKGPEDVVLKTANYTEINLIGNYADTARVDFQILNEDGSPAAQAKVDFKIYNYAEYYSAITRYADKDGHTSLTSGLGDLVVWASKDGKFGYEKVSFGKDSLVTIKLASVEEGTRKQKITPPQAHATLPEVSDEMSKANRRRLAQEDSIRNAYIDTAFVKSDNVFLTNSRANHRTIQKFMDAHQDNPERVQKLLSTLSNKDFRDITLDVLEDSFSASDQLSPRVEDEMLVMPFKEYLKTAFSQDEKESFTEDPQNLVRWIVENIKLMPQYNNQRIAQSPVGVMRSKVSDGRSRNIFFVDVARSLGIEAKKDFVTSKVQYKKDGEWKNVDFNDASKAPVNPKGTLMLTSTTSSIVPEYYKNFSISKIENGSALLLNYDEGMSRKELQLEVGKYLLTTGVRLADGSVLACDKIFTINEGKTTSVEMEFSDPEEELSVIGNFNSEAIFTPYNPETHSSSTPCSILSTTGRGYFLVAVIRSGHEPSTHVLKEICQMSKSFEAWERPILFIFESKDEADLFKASDYGELPSNSVFGIDSDGAIMSSIREGMKTQQKPSLPILMIADTFNRVVVFSQGYRIGLGSSLAQDTERLSAKAK